MKNEILEFIKRRFYENCHWTDGNCYWFAKILCERFPLLVMYYCPIEGHFVVSDGENLYDWNGIYYTDNCINFSKLKDEDPLWYNRLIRDCVN